MSAKIKLSICIPTYNRAVFIGETLDSVISQATEEVEIVVSDNASTDSTEEVVMERKKIFANIRYYRWPKNAGADMNYLRVIELAEGEYCWLLGSDDCLKSGAIKRIIGELSRNYDIYLCNRTDCDIDLRVMKDKHWLEEGQEDGEYNFSKRDDLLKYLEQTNDIGGLFSYISSIGIKRNKWMEYANSPDVEKFIGSAYVHVAVLFSFIVDGGTLMYINNPLVLNRSGNDSFFNGSLGKRALLDLNGYSKLATVFFAKDDVVYNGIINVLKRYFQRSWYCSFRSVLVLRLLSDKKDWDDLIYKSNIILGKMKYINIINLLVIRSNQKLAIKCFQWKHNIIKRLSL